MPEIVPPFKEERNESPGEAQIRLAAWIALLAGIFGLRFYSFEREALAKALGPVIRKWPQIARWKTP